MPEARDFRATIRERAHRQPKFREALHREAQHLLQPGDEQTAKAILQNYLSPLRPTSFTSRTRPAEASSTDRSSRSAFSREPSK